MAVTEPPALPASFSTAEPRSKRRALGIASSETHNANTSLVTQTIVENSRLVQEVQPELAAAT